MATKILDASDLINIVGDWTFGPQFTFSDVDTGTINVDNVSGFTFDFELQQTATTAGAVSTISARVLGDFLIYGEMQYNAAPPIIPVDAIITRIQIRFAGNISGETQNTGTLAGISQILAGLYGGFSSSIPTDPNSGTLLDEMTLNNTDANANDSASCSFADEIDLSGLTLSLNDLETIFRYFFFGVGTSSLFVAPAQSNSSRSTPGLGETPTALANLTAAFTDFEVEVTYDIGPPPDFEITGNVTVDIALNEETSLVDVDIDASAIYQPSAIIGNIQIDIDASSQYGNNVVTSNIDVSIDATIATVISTNPSGLYVLSPGKRNDTIYLRDQPESSTDVEIPDPFIKTAYFGG